MTDNTTTTTETPQPPAPTLEPNPAPTATPRKRKPKVDIDTIAPTTPPAPQPGTPAPHPIKAIRRAGVPLIGIETPDPAQTIRDCAAAMNGKAAEMVMLKHDLLNGLAPLNKPAQEWYAQAGPDGTALEPLMTANPAEALGMLAKNPPKRGLVFIMNAHRIIEQPGQGFNPAISQAIWNLRDIFKTPDVASTLILLAPMLTLPPELARDVVIITEALPDRAALGKIVADTLDDAKLPPQAPEEIKTTVDTLTGLSSFEAEQTLALSLRATGIDRADLWTRKVKAIESTPGLTVWRGKETLADVAGNANAARILSDTISGPLDCTCIVFADEIDKSMSAANTDTSGTTQDQNKALLSYLQDYDAIAALFLGPPGTGKTYLCKALAGHFGIPLIMLDLGALKGSLVGQSEANMREAIRKIHAMSEGKALWLGACNRDAGLPPELRRRFSYQLLFFDLPDRAEKDAAWKLNCAGLKFRDQKISLRPDQVDRSGINDDGWTAAEIRNACLKAHAMNVTLAEAAKSIVPISKSAGDVVTALRKSAHNRYISASKPGLYTYTETATQAQKGRKMELI